jgi:hypothetical protein
MTDVQEQIGNVERKAREATAKASPWICFMARAGYAAKGVTYVMVGVLAILAAFSYSSGKTGGTSVAMASLLDRPFGWVALVLIAVGLAGYALWCLVLAVADPEREGRDLKGLRKRFVHLFKAVAHLGLVGVAVGLLVGVAFSSRERDAIEEWTARLMTLPLGIWLVAIAGGCVVGAGIFQMYKAWRPEQVDDQLRTWQLPERARSLVHAIGRFGVAARGVVFGIVGAFMLVAAYRANPEEAKGVGRALAFVQQQWEGRYLLALVALGLVSYGLFQLILARYRRIDPT